ncbi:MAG TPA: DNA-3-methyladenine glycosylase [Thermosynechococcaceae cyanobacterium]
MASSQPQTPYLDTDWLSRPSIAVAPDLIGCALVRQMSDRSLWRGVIVETEAYGPDDPACHAYRRRTARNWVMFGEAGMSYVYLIYGIYHCFNVVTDVDGVASAVLIRALQLETIPPWIDPKEKLDRVAAGPGKLCRALQIDLSLTAQPLLPDRPLWLEPRPPEFQEKLEQETIDLTQTTRIGLTQGVDLPWRWYLTHSAAVSKRVTIKPAS